MVRIIAPAAVSLYLVIWAAFCRRRLAVMDEHVNSAMAQIGVQVSSRFDTLAVLLDLACGCAPQELPALLEAVKSRRGAITASSTPDDVLRQEGVIADALERITVVAERHPELKASERYVRCRSAMDRYETMVCTSRLIYNDSVTRLNRALRLFPDSLVAGIFGFHPREYLEAPEAHGSAAANVYENRRNAS